jgi:rhodanese-related sulfurtransferase
MWKRIVWQTIVMLFAASTVALFTNSIRNDQVSLVADWSSEARLKLESGESMLIPLEEAYQRCASGEAVFLDARSPDLYQLGHILCARSLPWETVEAQYGTAMEGVTQDCLIVAYCDGEHCSLSESLARQLLDMGYQNVRVLVNGWTRWVNAGLPISDDSGRFIITQDQCTS